VVLDVGEESPANRAVVALSLKQQVAGVGRAVEVEARVAQFGDPARQGPTRGPGSPQETRPGAPRAEVSLWVDGERRESREVGFHEGSSETIAFRFRFTEPGPHRVEARLDADRLSEDDVRYLAVEVVDRLPVLIVTRKPGGVPVGRRPAREADLLELALAPRLQGTRTPEVLFRPRVIDAEEFRQLRAADLAAEALVILADLPDLEREAARLLEEYVRGGGGLLIFAGESAGASADEQGGRGVLPARLLSLEGGAGAAGDGSPETKPAQAAPPAASPGEVLAGHPAFSELGPGIRGELSKVRLHRWWRVEPEEGASVIARLAGGAPFMVEKLLGRGRSLLVATGAGPAASDLPARPVFVPFLHGLAYHLAARRAEGLDVPLGGTFVETLPSLEAGATFTVTDPGGGSRRAEAGPSADPGAGAASTITYGPILLPGFHTVAGSRAGEKPLTFAANVDPGESDLRRIGPEPLARLAGELGLVLVRNLADLRPTGGGEPIREEWWRPLLAASIALMLLETLFTRALGRGRAPWRRMEGP
jgi:hypothetical protein